MCKFPTKECKYAHGNEDRKPLPKHELCERNQIGKCRLPSSEVCC